MTTAGERIGDKIRESSRELLITLSHAKSSSTALVFILR